jgi:hypothetical protein
MKRFGLRTKIGLAVGALVMGMVTIASVALYQVGRMGKVPQQIEKQSVEPIIEVGQFVEVFLSTRVAIRQYLLSDDSGRRSQSKREIEEKSKALLKVMRDKGIRRRLGENPGGKRRESAGAREAISFSGLR